MTKRFSLLLVVVGVLLSVVAGAQEVSRTHMDAQLGDAMTEMEHDKFTLRFFDALDGKPLTAATVTVEGQGSRKSDEEGKAQFPIPEDGVYKMTVEKTGYITTTISIEIMAGTIFFNRFSISPSLAEGKVRVVLDWSDKPKDLDAHMVKAEDYHISYRHMRVAKDGSARLDRDDTDGYGPETITVNVVDGKATYEFFIHDYTHRAKPNDKGLADSRAMIKVYGKGRLLKVYKVPTDKAGNIWDVFRIEKGEIVDVNTVSGR